MRRNLDKRITEIEKRETDWISKLECIDYIGLTDYNDGNWNEVYIDDTVTVYKHNSTGEVRGAYFERRSRDEIRDAGGDPAYL